MNIAFFEIIGAFVVWMFSGFKGMYKDRLGRQQNIHNGHIGLITFFGLLALIIVILKLF